VNFSRVGKDTFRGPLETRPCPVYWSWTPDPSTTGLILIVSLDWIPRRRPTAYWSVRPSPAIPCCPREYRRVCLSDRCQIGCSLSSPSLSTPATLSCIDAVNSGCVSCPLILQPNLRCRPVGIATLSCPSFAPRSAKEIEASLISTSIQMTHGALTFPVMLSKVPSL
jgi:hypothetical protein